MRDVDAEAEEEDAPFDSISRSRAGRINNRSSRLVVVVFLLVVCGRPMRNGCGRIDAKKRFQRQIETIDELFVDMFVRLDVAERLDDHWRLTTTHETRVIDSS